MSPKQKLSFIVPIPLFLLLLVPVSAVYPDSATVGMRFEGKNTEKVYIDGENRTTGYYTNLGFPYAIAQNSFLLGIVPDGTFDHLVYRNDSKYKFEASLQGSTSSFYLPFTDGTYENIEDRESYINPGIFGTSLLEYASPNFAFDLNPGKTVRIILSYTRKKLEFPHIGPGIYNLKIKNKGMINGNLTIGVTR